MSKPRFMARLPVIILAAVAVTICAHLFLVRPWMLRWGANDAELHRARPGDELSPAAAYVATRAVTIHAPAETVWRWVVQVGQDQAGFYSYTWLENLFRADMHNSDRIVEEWQTRKAGDTVWLARKDRYHGEARQTAALVTPNRALVLVSPLDYEKICAGGYALGSWSFIIVPMESGTSRLVLRSRSGPIPRIWEKAFAYLVFDPAHFIMERKMMLGVKHRSENAGLG